MFHVSDALQFFQLSSATLFAVPGSCLVCSGSHLIDCVATDSACFLCRLVECRFLPPPRVDDRFCRQPGGVSAATFHSAAPWLRFRGRSVGFRGTGRSAAPRNKGSSNRYEG